MESMDEIRTNPLFASGADREINACLNYGVDNWYSYASGYRRAAEILTDYVLETHQEQDVLVFPALFLWRHHLELQLKVIARGASRLLGQDWSPTNVHNLSELFASAWRLFQACFTEFGEKLPRADLDCVKAALAGFKTVDMKSMVFRYPEDLQGSKHLRGVTHINFDVVAKHMTVLSDTLDGIDTALSVFSDWQQEANPFE